MVSPNTTPGQVKVEAQYLHMIYTDIMWGGVLLSPFRDESPDFLLTNL